MLTVFSTLTKLKQNSNRSKTTSAYNAIENNKKGRKAMNRNDKQFIAQKIRAQYIEKESTELDELRSLDKAVKRPANIFAYIFGSLGALIMGSGMSLVMTDIGAILGLANPLIPGIVIGVIGMAMALVNYPIYKSVLDRRKDKYGKELLALSEKIINS